MMKEVTGKLKGRLMRTNTKRHEVTTRALGSISISATNIDGFTIVEIVINGKHYHGLTKQNEHADNWNEDTGIVIAFRRAFDLMMKDQFTPKMKGINFGFPLGGKSHIILPLSLKELDAYSSRGQQDRYCDAIKMLMDAYPHNKVLNLVDNPCAEIPLKFKSDKPSDHMALGIALHNTPIDTNGPTICKVALL